MHHRRERGAGDEKRAASARLWGSALSRWNAKKMGPKRDLYGELVSALRRRGKNAIATEHHIRVFNRYLPGPEKSPG
jgi:hypothetical protein